MSYGYPNQAHGYGQPPAQGGQYQHNQYGQYPPPQQQGGYGPPPGAPYGQQSPPPPGLNGQYGQSHGYYGGPQGGPQGGFQGGPPGPAMAAGYPAPPSPGYIPGQMPPTDMAAAADALRSAMKGFGTNERELTAVMSRLDPLQVNGVKAAFQQRHHRNLIHDLTAETSGHFKECLLAIARGPLDEDVFNLNHAVAGLGTKEALLNDVLLGRSNADLNAIKAAYHQTYRRSLESDVKADLSMKTERLFSMVLAARRNEESTSMTPQQIDADVVELYHATEGHKVGTDQVTVCAILSSRSDGQLRSIHQAYQQRYQRPLHDVLKKAFSGHMEQSLLFILDKAVDPAKHDADLLEDSMKGMGTKDHLLITRLVTISRDRTRLQQAKAAYKHFHKQDLSKRIKGETSGHYEKMLVALVESVN